MHGHETQMLRRHYLEQGVSKRALVRKLGVSRDTIHRWIVVWSTPSISAMAIFVSLCSR